jgi:hypothetical protein
MVGYENENIANYVFAKTPPVMAGGTIAHPTTTPACPDDFRLGTGNEKNMNTEMRPLIEINQQAIHLLYKELGVTDAVRLLKQFTQGYGNYTQERETLFDKKPLDEIVSEIEKRRKSG